MSRILSDIRTVFLSLSVRKDHPITVIEASLSTMYMLSLCVTPCFSRLPFETQLLKKFVLWDVFVRVSYYVEELSVEFCTPCILQAPFAPHSTLYIFDQTVLSSDSLRFLFLPPVWMTFRGGSLFPECCSCHNLT